MLHSVTLIKEKCKGCTKCIKKCPTEAIRVRRGRAVIMEEKCIDCGQCIIVCPHYAKKAAYDSLERMDEFRYAVALPAPSLYGQFKNLDDVNLILSGLLRMGFDDVFEVSVGADLLSDFVRNNTAKTAVEGPMISSACPAVVRLICMRFPKLIGNISKHIAPVEIAAICARQEAMKKTGLSADEIGIFFITPCPAKITAIHSPSHLKEPVIDGAFSMIDIYRKLLHHMQRKNLPNLVKSKAAGVGWALSGGELYAGSLEESIAVDGIEHVINILEDVEDGQLSHVHFLELAACHQGCVGGCLAVANPFIAKVRIQNLIKGMKATETALPAYDFPEERFLSEKPLEENSVWQLAENRMVAMERYHKIIALTELLPGLDCGSCGTPGCRALAQDVVLGLASEDDCIFRMRERMQKMGNTGNTDDYLPPPFRKGDD